MDKSLDKPDIIKGRAITTREVLPGDRLHFKHKLGPEFEGLITFVMHVTDPDGNLVLLLIAQHDDKEFICLMNDNNSGMGYAARLQNPELNNSLRKFIGSHQYTRRPVKFVWNTLDKELDNILLPMPYLAPKEYAEKRAQLKVTHILKKEFNFDNEPYKKTKALILQDKNNLYYAETKCNHNPKCEYRALNPVTHKKVEELVKNGLAIPVNTLYKNRVRG